MTRREMVSVNVRKRDAVGYPLDIRMFNDLRPRFSNSRGWNTEESPYIWIKDDQTYQDPSDRMRC